VLASAEVKGARRVQRQWPTIIAMPTAIVIFCLVFMAVADQGIYIADFPCFSDLFGPG
jgi:hypothetical protein